MNKATQLLLFAAIAWPPGTRAEAAPTFAEDVAPIVFNKCTSCHRPGEAARWQLPAPAVPRCQRHR